MRNLTMVRNIALTAFLVLGVPKAGIAQRGGLDCYACGECQCCDENGKIACYIDCPRGICDCCGLSCIGDACN